MSKRTLNKTATEPKLPRPKLNQTTLPRSKPSRPKFKKLPSRPKPK